MSVAGRATCAYRAPGLHNFRNRPGARFRLYKGFTLIELLVVIAVIAILAAILFPVFATTQEAGRRAKCSLQAKQLAAAIVAYADDNNSRYIPAAPDVYADNLRRWHGARTDIRHDFEPGKGPLWPYVSRSGGLKECPSARMLKHRADFSNPYSSPAFESGCGGFGYNGYYVGGTYYKNPAPECSEIASLTTDIAQPSRTLMLADAAMPKRDPSTGAEYLIEYSIAEPPFLPPKNTTALSPSIHFRHNGLASVAWCDGHVTAERMTWTADGQNAFGADNRRSNAGWIGPQDNSLFDNR